MNNNDKRILTLVVELQGNMGDWVWDAHMKGPVNGLKVRGISEGNLMKEYDKLLEESTERDLEEDEF